MENQNGYLTVTAHEEQVQALGAIGIKRIEKVFFSWLENVATEYPISYCEIPHIGAVNFEVPEEVDHPKSKSVVHFFDDWVVIFNSLIANSRVDEFGSRAFVFEAAINFFYSRSVIIVTVILTLYLWIIVIYGSGYFNSSSGNLQIVVNFGMYFLPVMFYLWGGFILRGSILPPDLHKTYPSNESNSKTTVWATFLHLCAVLYRTTKAQNSTEALDETTSKLEKGNPVGGNPMICVQDYIVQLVEKEDVCFEHDFYETLNVGTKYMLFATTEEFKIPDRTHIMLKVSFIAVVLVNVFFFVVATFSNSSILLPFCGIPMGNVTNDVILFSGNVTDDYATSYPAKVELYCFDRRVQVFGSVFGILNLVQGTLVFCGCMTAFAGLLHTAEIAKAMAKSWMKRFSGLRKVSSAPPEKAKNTKEATRSVSSVESSNAEIPPAVEDSLDNESRENDCEMLSALYTISPFIKRDAYERYLFIQKFMATASERWQTFACFVCISCAAWELYGYYVIILAYKTGHPFAGPIWVMLALYILLGLVVLTYPLYCMAYANTKVQAIGEMFVGSSPDDFGPMGDIDDWRDFFGATPLYWTIFSIPVNFEVMQTYLGSAGAALPMVMFLFSHFL